MGARCLVQPHADEAGHVDEDRVQQLAEQHVAKEKAAHTAHNAEVAVHDVASQRADIAEGVAAPANNDIDDRIAHVAGTRYI